MTKEIKKVLAQVQLMTILSGAGVDITDVADAKLLTEKERKDLENASEKILAICKRLADEIEEYAMTPADSEDKEIEDVKKRLGEILAKGL